jgi:hypothetical protein
MGEHCTESHDRHQGEQPKPYERSDGARPVFRRGEHFDIKMGGFRTITQLRLAAEFPRSRRPRDEPLLLKALERLSKSRQSRAAIVARALELTRRFHTLLDASSTCR